MFGKSYEYTAKYRAFAKAMKAKEREEKRRAKLSADSADTVDDPVTSDRSAVSA